MARKRKPLRDPLLEAAISDLDEWQHFPTEAAPACPECGRRLSPRARALLASDPAVAPPLHAPAVATPTTPPHTEDSP